MGKISLRLRLTLVTTVVLVLICVLLTSVSMASVTQIVTPAYASLYDIENDLIGFGTVALTISEDGDYYESGAAELPSDTTFYSVAGVTAEYAEYIQASSVTLAASAQTAAFQLTEAKSSYDYYSLFIMGFMIIAGSFLVYFALGYALKPVRRLSADIQDISENHLSTRVEAGTRGDEINQLAISFNHMLERLEIAFSAQKQFSTAAAHELKTPLAAIRANLDVLALDEHPGEDEIQETLEVVRNQTVRMTRLVEDLFAMSSLQDYDMGEMVDIDGLISHVVGELEPVIAEMDLDVTASSCGRTVRGNSLMLGRALSNLVENAVKYNRPAGGIDIECACENEALTISVADTGMGIPQEHLPLIFNAFYRVDDSRSRKLGGAGLGLSITREIIEKHGGRVTAASAPGEGSVFTVTLPLEQRLQIS